MDKAIFNLINGFAGRSENLDGIFIFLNSYSLWVFAGVLVICFFAKRRLFWFALLATLISRGLLKEVISFLYSRPRPFEGLEKVNLLIDTDHLRSSFPSGHASFLFAVAFSVYLFNKKFGVILILLAGIFSFLRIFAGVHYPSDILGGVIVAGVSVFLVYIFRNKFRK